MKVSRIQLERWMKALRNSMSKGPAIAGSMDVSKHRNEVSVARKQTQRTQFKAEMKVRPEWPHTRKTSLFSSLSQGSKFMGCLLSGILGVVSRAPFSKTPVTLKTSPIHQLFLKGSSEIKPKHSP